MSASDAAADFPQAERDLVREAQERVETEERLQQEQEASSKELAAGSGAGGDSKSEKLNEVSLLRTDGRLGCGRVAMVLYACCKH